MSLNKRPPTDLRRQRKQTERRLLILVIVVLVFVGGGLIALIYGPGALLTALPCLLGGAGVISLLYLLFALAERWANR
jgi:protein-S-isoprenylcysteine O-methyltransferase Ste14